MIEQQPFLVTRAIRTPEHCAGPVRVRERAGIGPSTAAHPDFANADSEPVGQLELDVSRALDRERSHEFGPPAGRAFTDITGPSHWLRIQNEPAVSLNETMAMLVPEDARYMLREPDAQRGDLSGGGVCRLAENRKQQRDEPGSDRRTVAASSKRNAGHGAPPCQVDRLRCRHVHDQV
jgi:hypothetical protein